MSQEIPSCPVAETCMDCGDRQVCDLFLDILFMERKIQKPNIFLGEVAKTACCPECGKSEIDDTIKYVPLKRSVLPRNKDDMILYCPKCGLEFDAENEEEMDQVKWVDNSCLE